MSRLLAFAKNFRSFAELAATYAEGVDYRITRLLRAESATGIVAPHGGPIEAHTVELATEIAGEDFSLYLFEGIRSTDNYAALHLTSHYFDEPRCLEMLAGCDDVVAIHGCGGDGEVVLVGGLDKDLGTELGAAMIRAGLVCFLEGHKFPGTHPNNICNRGRRSVGVQLEISASFRESLPHRRTLVTVVREVLLKRIARRTQPCGVQSSV